MFDSASRVGSRVGRRGSIPVCRCESEMKIRKTPIVVAFIVVAVLTVPLVQRFAGDSRGSMLVDIGHPEWRALRPSVIASGRLAHARAVELTAEVIGPVEAVHVVEGQTVSEGELVLEIEDEALVSDVEQNQAAVRMQNVDIERQRIRIDYLRSQNSRNEMLFERGLLDEAALDATTHELALAEVDLESSRERLAQMEAALRKASELLDKSSVYAPIDGVVTTVSIRVGETAIASTTNIRGSELITIADPSHLMTEVEVDEAEIASLAVGQKAQVTAVAWPDRLLPGTVEFIAGAARTVSGSSSASFTVRIRIEDSMGIELRPGMSCRVEIFTDDVDEVLAVPLGATLSERDMAAGADRLHVFVYRDGVVARQEFEGALSDDGYIEILSGLEPEDAIVIGPVQIIYELRDGDAVVAREDPD